MNEFKFDCPTCGQHILAKTEWAGRRIECPSCETRITIPTPGKVEKKPKPAAVVPPPSAAANLSNERRREQPAAKPAGKPSTPAPPPIPKVTAPAPAPPPVPKVTPPTTKPAPIPKVTAASSTQPPAPKATVPKIPAPTAPIAKPSQAETTPTATEQLRIATVTPAVKLELIRAARRRIANEASWLPGKVKGETAYAAKMEGGDTVLLDAKDPEATRFSFIGAFMLALHERQVIRTAFGRRKFLDEELPDAVNEVLQAEMSDEERERATATAAEPDWLSISYAQCLAALDLLEEQFSQRVAQLQIEKAKNKLGNVRLPDLVHKLEKKSKVTPEDVATALYHELLEVRHRLEKLESRIVHHK